jgi:hypothetical protein
VGKESMGSMDENRLVCFNCGLPLEPAEAKFSYLKHEFTHTVLRCPACKLLYIPEGLAAGKMSEVETLLEDK